MAQTRENFDVRAFIARYGGGTILKRGVGQVIYAQGDPADALYYVLGGTIKVTINSEFGKEAVIALLDRGSFFGEGCLTENRFRASTVVTVNDCEFARFDAAFALRVLDEDVQFSKLLIMFLLGATERLKTDLIDQLFNSSERRLARILLTLADTGEKGRPGFITIAINQDMLARMVGTTRSRINAFMNKFRRLGYIDYNGRIEVHESLSNVILHDQRRSDDQ